MTIAMKSKIALATFALSLCMAIPATATDKPAEAKAAEKPAEATAPAAAGDAISVAITEAKAAKKKAASVGGEWRDIGKFIKKAEEAAKGGETKKALKLAKKAKFQSDAGIKQAKNQEELAKEFPDYLK